jgi:hypothetical protein
MKLLTKEIEKNIPPLYSQDGKNPEKVKIAVKFFCPWNNWTWYVTEGTYDEEQGTWIFFGLVRGFDTELGYFSLAELEEITHPQTGLKIERDMYFGKHTLAEAKEKQI